MSSDRIGGHVTPFGTATVGLDVFRVKLRDGRSVIRKKAYTEIDREGIAREAACLKRLQQSKFTPDHYWETEDEICQEDLGEPQEVNDQEAFRQGGVRLLWDLRQAGVRHGDLTHVNAVVTGDAPRAIDFQQSNFFAEEPPQKRPAGDSYLLWAWMRNVPSKKYSVPDTNRMMRRWLAVMGELGLNKPYPESLAGKTLLDLGCYQGDFTAMAASEGMIAVGIDKGGFRSGENSIKAAKQLWSGMESCLTFQQQDILSLESYEADVVLLFSTWPYIYNDYGEEVAFELLEKIVQQCGIFFFETQLYGDGPGPEFLEGDQDVAELLARFGTSKPLVTIPVTGRSTERTVWAVRKS